ncbi:MAG: 2TM domain-containing protein [Acidimicrobiia bacterium]|nr:2TM domain-containing protein [Acidimicrobiia bacterium]MDH4308511.1 2TM domain-containing protein [Acidimicrobiia bacterium]MDH5292353.1 2TM domain-containing protein [Acidimicrobiia bacterium]
MSHEDRVLVSAKRNLKAIRDFMYHLMVFIFVSGLLVILDVRAGVGDQAVLGLDWAYWVILFWGIGLVGHAIFAFFGDHRIEARYEMERTKEHVGS